MRKPRLLDICCKQGGASAGYAAAGFEELRTSTRDVGKLAELKYQEGADAVAELATVRDGLHRTIRDMNAEIRSLRRQVAALGSTRPSRVSDDLYAQGWQALSSAGQSAAGGEET